MPRVVLISGHYLRSRRRAGFHWLADAWWRGGWEVVFVTAALSRLSRLRGDYRFAYPVRREANRLVWQQPRLGSFVWYTPYHPANLRIRWLNRLASGLFRRYADLPLGEVEPSVAAADLIVFESTPALLLFDRCKRLNPSARFVYRVSDDLHLLNNHPVVLDAEAAFAPRFDLLSTPSDALHRRFAGLPNARRHDHGVRKALFDAASASPYDDRRPVNAVFIGVSRLDVDFLDRAARRCPDWGFHVIGPLAGLPRRDNVIAHGELAFERTVPFVQHADVGLHTLQAVPGVEVFTDSLKVIQYTYCRLPIVAPELLRCGRPNMLYYRPGDDASIRRALDAAATFGRTTIRTDGIYSWDELAAVLAGEMPSSSQ